MKTLLLAPHHDDETLFASYLCLTYDPLVIVCYGNPAANGVPASVRSSEFGLAMVQLNVHECIEWPVSDTEGGTADDLLVRMRHVRDHTDWDLVFAPAVEPARVVDGEVAGGHPQHNNVGRLADRVFGGHVTVEHYTTYTYPPLTRSRSERPIPHDPSWIFRKHAALACYRSAAQTPSYRHFAEDMAEYLA